MNRRFMMVGALLALAGCSNGDVAAPPTNQVAALPPAASTEPAAAEPCAENAFYSPLPDARIRFDFPFRIARDRVYTTEAGAPRRGLTIDYLEGDAGQVWTDIGKSMEAAGFSATGDVTGTKGTFVKPGRPSLYVEVKPGPAEGLSGPDAKGNVWISWSVKS